MDSRCTFCKGEGWVCEDHPNIAWNSGDGCRIWTHKGIKQCGGAGMPCSCNKANPPWSFKAKEEV